MIREITLQHFKCFERLTLPLGDLTMLSGVNASGKSTVVQALALLRQSVSDAEWSGELLLDGTSVQLGTAADVIDKVHGRRTFALGLAGESFSVRWQFGDPETQERDAISVPLHAVTWREGGECVEADPSEAWRGLLPRSLETPRAHALRDALRTLDHIGAERLGPRETYRLGSESWHQVVGAQGERAPGALWWFGDDPVDRAMCVGDAPPTVRGQVQAWLDLFFPGVVFQLDRVPNASALTLGFRTSTETNFHRPQHVGYGITHLLPVLVAGVRSTAGRLLVVENPEVHLHPAGQAAVEPFPRARRVARGEGRGGDSLDHVLSTASAERSATASCVTTR
ncbi:MAG: AAA family ATPase [Polyangiales bacterium]